MAKTKKVTFNMIAADIPKAETKELRFGTDGQFVMQVKHRLDFQEAVQFVRSVAGSCVDENNGEYNPELFDFAVRVNILTEYAGVTGLDADKMDRAFRVVYESPLVQMVTELIDNDQLGRLVEEARERMEYLANAMANASAARMSELVARMDAMIDSGKEAMEMLDSDSFKEMLRQAADIAGGPETKDARSVHTNASGVVVLER